MKPDDLVIPHGRPSSGSAVDWRTDSLSELQAVLETARAKAEGTIGS